MALSHISSSNHEQRGVKRKQIGNEKLADPYDRSKLHSTPGHTPYWTTHHDKAKRTFRLLILHGSRYDRDSHMCVDLMRVHIDSNKATDPLSDFDTELPDFDAVSYAWGKAASDHMLWCTACTPFDYLPKEPLQQVLDRSDRGSYLAVSQTVRNILKDLQPCTGYRVLWLDAICIDQKDSLDRAEQVPLMSTIYRHAKQVIVWLPPPPRTADNYWSNVSSLHASRAIKKLSLLGLCLADTANKRRSDGVFLCSAPSSNDTPLWSNKIHDSEYVGPNEIDELLTFLARPWFTRTWVVQEVVLARKVVVEYGKYCIDWDDIGHACRAAKDGGPVFRSIASQLRMFSDIELFRRAYRVLLRTLNIQEKTDLTLLGHDTRDDEIHSRLYLHSLLRATRNRNATNPRDKVYGLLGLACGTALTERIRPTGTSNYVLSVDYTSPLLNVYFDAAMACMRTQGPGASLDFLGDAGNIPEHVRHRKRKATSQRPDRYLTYPLSWPSWVPDWSIEVAPSFHRIDSLLQVGNSASQGQKSFASASLQRCQVMPETYHGPCLRVRGVRVLIIAEVAKNLDAMRRNHKSASIGAYPGTSLYYHEVLEAFPDRLQNIRDRVWDDDVDVAWRRKAKVLDFWAHSDPPAHNNPDLINHTRPLAALRILKSDSIYVEAAGTDHSQQQRIHEVDADTNDDKTATTDTVFFRAFANFLGEGPPELQRGDEIAVLFGCRAPFVVRKVSANSAHYLLIGECFVHGLMYGEAMQNLHPTKIEYLYFQ